MNLQEQILRPLLLQAKSVMTQLPMSELRSLIFDFTLYPLALEPGGKMRWGGGLATGSCQFG